MGTIGVSNSVLVPTMLGFLPPLARGAIASLLLLLNTLFWIGPLLTLALVRLVLPFKAVRPRVDPWINAIATRWIAGNSGWMRLTQRTVWDVQGVDELAYHGWYLVNSNHLGAVDIFALQHVLNRRIPLLKFFIKQQLFWVPIMGLAWWALDFPFMKRHSAAALARNPALREQDRETTRRACEKFALVPTSVMNFAEGTRFTPAKHAAQGSPYRHLLKPRTGALALALHAMGRQFHSLIDVTLAYPDGVPTFWAFLCGRGTRVVMRVRELPIPPAFCDGDYEGDPAFREALHEWLHALWAEKDREIERLLRLNAAGEQR